MSRPSWIAPLYGYVVCVVAVITFLISASSMVDAAFARTYPLQSREGLYGPMGQSLSSFESFRASDRDRSRMEPRPAGASSPADTLSTAELRVRYEALRAERMEQVRFWGTQRLVKHGLLILLAAALFTLHWRWLRGQREAGA
jgi:hypothetical protein